MKKIAPQRILPFLILLLSVGCKLGEISHTEEIEEENTGEQVSEFEKIQASIWSRKPKLNLTDVVPQGINLHSVASQGSKILLIKVSEISNIDYIRWEACPSDAPCLTGLSGSPYTFLTSLPVGYYHQVRARLCIKGLRSETGKESCTGWSEGVSHEQIISISTPVYAYLQIMDESERNIRTLGEGIVALSQTFIDNAFSCPAPDRDYLNKLAVFTALGAIVVGDQVSKLNPDSISLSSEGLFLTDGKDADLREVQRQLEEI